MKKRCLRQMGLQIETMEPRALLSGLTAAPHAETNVVARHAVTDVLDNGMSHHIGHRDAGLGSRSHLGDAASKASPSETSFIFQSGAKFNFRVNSSTQTAAISQTTQFSGYSLTVTPFALARRDGVRPEVLDLNFQYSQPLMKNGQFSFGPIGLPTNIPVLQKVKLTKLFVYFTYGDEHAIKNIKTWGIFEKGFDPRDPKQEVFFLNGGLPKVVDKSFFVLNVNNGNGYTLFPADFAKMGMQSTGVNAVNGIHIDMEVVPV
jgi:hypothetical protein